MKNNIKQARELAGKQQKACADAIGLTLRAWQGYEQGIREPKYETLCQIADLFGVTTDYLLGREAPAPETPLRTFAKGANLKELEEILIKEYLELNDNQREAVLDFIRRCIEQEQQKHYE